MKISELIARLEAIEEREGDIDVELPNGSLIRKVQVVTVKQLGSGFTERKPERNA